MRMSFGASASSTRSGPSLSVGVLEPEHHLGPPPPQRPGAEPCESRRARDQGECVRRDVVRVGERRPADGAHHSDTRQDACSLHLRVRPDSLHRRFPCGLHQESLQAPARTLRVRGSIILDPRPGPITFALEPDWSALCSLRFPLRSAPVSPRSQPSSGRCSARWPRGLVAASRTLRTCAGCPSWSKILRPHPGRIGGGSEAHSRSGTGALDKNGRGYSDIRQEGWWLRVQHRWLMCCPRSPSQTRAHTSSRSSTANIPRTGPECWQCPAAAPSEELEANSESVR